MQVEKTVFISYRRTNEYTARAVYQHLTANGYDAFLDFETIDSGAFERVILNQIAARAHFLIILTPSALERCNEPGDMVRREIEQAIALKRNVVPLMFEGFGFGAVSKYMTGQMAVLPQYNGVPVPRGYFDEAMNRLRARFLNKPLEMVLHPTPPADVPVVKQKQAAAEEHDSVTEEQLSAEEYYEHAFKHYEKNNYERAIGDYTAAIRLNPQFASAYNNRGLAHADKGNLDSAIEDYDEALRINPKYAVAYNNRGSAHALKGSLKEAIADYTEAIRYNPQFAGYYDNRGKAYGQTGKIDEAMSDFNEAIRIDPQFVDAYSNRGNSQKRIGNLEGAMANFDEAIRIDQQHGVAYNNRAEIYFERREFEVAHRDFWKAHELSPANPFPLAGLAISQHALGEIDRAKAYWKLLMGLDGHYRDAEWTGIQLDWREPLIEEARKLIAKL